MIIQTAGPQLSASAFHCVSVGAGSVIIENNRVNAEYWRAAAEGKPGYRLPDQTAPVCATTSTSSAGGSDPSRVVTLLESIPDDLSIPGFPATDGVMTGTEITTTTKTDLPLDEIFALARKALQNVKTSGAALLHYAMDAGDAFNVAEERIRRLGGSWKRQLRDQCFISVRTAFVYQQLARHRADIEKAIDDAGITSLRAALRLISKPKELSEPEPDAAEPESEPEPDAAEPEPTHRAPKPAPTPTKTKPSLTESWESSQEDRDVIRDQVLKEHYASADGRHILSLIRDKKTVIADFLDALGVDGMLDATSRDFKRQHCALIRDLVINEHYASAGGRDIFWRIRAATKQHNQVIADLLDALGVDGMQATASPEFKKDLRAKLPANPNAWLVEKDAGTIARTIVEAAGRPKADTIRASLSPTRGKSARAQSRLRGRSGAVTG
jgi:hypothetical protein